MSQPVLPNLVRRWTLFAFSGLVDEAAQQQRHQEQQALLARLIDEGATHVTRSLTGWHFDASGATVERLRAHLPNEHWRALPFKAVPHGDANGDHPLLASVGIEDGVFCVSAGLGEALRFARALGERLDVLGRPVQPVVNAARGDTTTGLVFQNEITGHRVRAMANASTGGCRLYLGEREDFDPFTQVPGEHMVPLDVNLDDPVERLDAVDLAIAFLRE